MTIGGTLTTLTRATLISTRQTFPSLPILPLRLRAAANGQQEKACTTVSLEQCASVFRNGQLSCYFCLGSDFMKPGDGCPHTCAIMCTREHRLLYPTGPKTCRAPIAVAEGAARGW